MTSPRQSPSALVENFKFISERDQIRSKEVELVRQFQGILLPQDSHSGGKMPWTKSYLWSLASSEFFAGSMGERCVARFRLGWRSVNKLQFLANASLRESMWLIQLDAGDRNMFVLTRTKADVCETAGNKNDLTPLLLSNPDWCDTMMKHHRQKGEHLISDSHNCKADHHDKVNHSSRRIAGFGYARRR